MNIEAIRKAAEAATPGKWNWWTSCSWRRLHSEQAGGQQIPVLMPTVASDGHPDLAVSVEDREFIAMANPATVLELVRLAEIGEAVERTAKGDENGYLEIPKFLRRKEQP